MLWLLISTSIAASYFAVKIRNVQWLIHYQSYLWQNALIVRELASDGNRVYGHLTELTTMSHQPLSLDFPILLPPLFNTFLPDESLHTPKLFSRLPFQTSKASFLKDGVHGLWSSSRINWYNYNTILRPFPRGIEWIKILGVGVKT